MLGSLEANRVGARVSPKIVGMLLVLGALLSSTVGTLDGEALTVADGTLLGVKDSAHDGFPLNVGIADGNVLNVGMLLGEDEGHVVPGSSIGHISHDFGQ